MKIGEYYEKNQNRISALSEIDWKIALTRCKEHIRWKIWQKTLSGAHSASNLGADPIDHYLGLSYEKILSGEWEWKDDYTLSQQMIRIINSSISKEVEKASTEKGKSFKTLFKDIEHEFYDLETPSDSDENDDTTFDDRLQLIEDAICGDLQLEILIDAIKEGMKRSEIADILEIQPRQLDKLREKLVRRVLNYQSSGK